ncbi:hypothetical protein ABK040_003112 [Willaertia magna]
MSRKVFDAPITILEPKKKPTKNQTDIQENDNIDESDKEIQRNEEESSFYEMARYLNSKKAAVNKNSEERNRRTLRKEDLEDAENEEEEFEPINVQPKFQRPLSSRMLPQFNTINNNSKEDKFTPQSNPQQNKGNRPTPRYNTKLLKEEESQLALEQEVVDEKEEEEEKPIKTRPAPKQLRSSTSNISTGRFVQESTNNKDSEKLQGEVNQLRREKQETIKINNERIKQIQDRCQSDLQEQKNRFEKMLSDKEAKIIELENENQRLREQIGLVDKTMNHQDTNRLLSELETLRSKVKAFEEEKRNQENLVENLKFSDNDKTKQIKEIETKIRQKEETITALQYKLENADKELKVQKEKELRLIDEKEILLAKQTEAENTAQSLSDKIKNMEYNQRQLIMENESLKKDKHNLENIKFQYEKTLEQVKHNNISREDEFSKFSVEANRLSQEREILMNREQQLLNELDSSKREIRNMQDIISRLELKIKSMEISSSFSTQSYLSQQQHKEPYSFNNDLYHSQFSSNPNNYLSVNNFSSQPAVSQNHNNFSSVRGNSYSTNEYFERQQTSPSSTKSVISENDSPKERKANKAKIMGTSYNLAPSEPKDSNNKSIEVEDIEDNLIHLGLEKGRLEGDLQKLLSVGIKSIASRKQKMTLEQRIGEIERETSKLKLKLRKAKLN